MFLTEFTPSYSSTHNGDDAPQNLLWTFVDSLFPELPRASRYNRQHQQTYYEHLSGDFYKQKTLNILTVRFTINSLVPERFVHTSACISTWKTVSDPTLGQTTTLYYSVCHRTLRNLPRFPPDHKYGVKNSWSHFTHPPQLCGIAWSPQTPRTHTSPIRHNCVASRGHLKPHAPILPNNIAGLSLEAFAATEFD